MEKIIALLLSSTLWFTCNGAPSSPGKADGSAPVMMDASVDTTETPSTTSDASVEMMMPMPAVDALPDVVEVSSPMADASSNMAEVSAPLPDPCMDPNAASVTFPLKIMQAGDSITRGTDEKGGYRAPLFEKLGAKAIPVGTLNPKDYGGGPGFHSGYNNIHTRTAAGYLQQWIDGCAIDPMTPAKPDIILLMLGTNGDGDGPEYVQMLIRPTLDKNPTVKIVVGAIPTSPTDNGAYARTFNTSLRAAILAVPEYGSRVFYVPETEFLLPTEFDPDNVHPNTLGYARIANAWYTKLSQIVCLKN